MNGVAYTVPAEVSYMIKKTMFNVKYYNSYDLTPNFKTDMHISQPTFLQPKIKIHFGFRLICTQTNDVIYYRRICWKQICSGDVF